MTSLEQAQIQQLFDRIREELDIEIKSLRSQQAPGAGNDYTRSMDRVRRTIGYAIEEFRKLPASGSN